MSTGATSPIAPPSDAARACAAAKTRRTVKPSTTRRLAKSRESFSSSTLQAQCRVIIVANLERYPPACFQALDEESWDAVVRLRNEKTAPSTGTGGLDGSGRLVPSISEKLLTEIEKTNPHLADSAVADNLVWSTCVEYRFKAGGLTRPPTLMYPWPVLVRRCEGAGADLVGLLQIEKKSEKSELALDRCIQVLTESPMNVALLRASGVGRQVKTFVKYFCKQSAPHALDVHEPRPLGGLQTGSTEILTPLYRLEVLLRSWKDIAAKSGVNMSTTRPKLEGADASVDVEKDLSLLESCHTWRALFSVLSQRETERRASQGARMREIRKNLASGRPKIVKVRPAAKRHEEILNRPLQNKLPTAAGLPRNSKLQKLREESAIVASRQKSSIVPKKRKPASFGAAVAFASVSQSTTSKHKPAGKVIALGAGRKLTLPSKRPKVSKHSITGRRTPSRR